MIDLIDLDAGQLADQTQRSPQSRNCDSKYACYFCIQHLQEGEADVLDVKKRELS